MILFFMKKIGQKRKIKILFLKSSNHLVAIDKADGLIISVSRVL